MRRTIIFPAVFISCLIIIWVSTVAAAHMPENSLPSNPSSAADDNAAARFCTQHGCGDGCWARPINPHPPFNAPFQRTILRKFSNGAI